MIIKLKWVFSLNPHIHEKWLLKTYILFREKIHLKLINRHMRLTRANGGQQYQQAMDDKDSTWLTMARSGWPRGTSHRRCMIQSHADLVLVYCQSYSIDYVDLMVLTTWSCRLDYVLPTYDIRMQKVKYNCKFVAIQTNSLIWGCCPLSVLAVFVNSFCSSAFWVIYVWLLQ